MLQSANEKIRVAQYLRMSTEHQEHSFHNQSEFIKRYADKHNMDIVLTYDDAGKSGVTMSGRQGLKDLIGDVVNHRINIKAVLVYDVSRFGRFQNTDEFAHYQYLFTQNGVKVIFCAEPMSEEHPEISMMALNMQRYGAAAYSKNLSEKVFAGQVNLIKRGYRQGGTAGYGLRRQLFDEHQQPKEILDYGKRKSIQTDRVKLIPGPQFEINIVNDIFDMFISQAKPERVIASELNRREIKAENSTQWTRAKVHQILTNEKYIGHNVYNRTSFKLKRQHIKNPESDWVCYKNAYQPIVPVDKFMMAREIILARSTRLTDEQFLESLKQLLKIKGQLSGFIIDEEDNIPSSSAYSHRFGGLLKAYSLIGYSPQRDYSYLKINEFLKEYHKDTINSVIADIYNANGWVEYLADRNIFRVNDEFELAILISRCQQQSSGKRRWKIRFDRNTVPDITIVLRMDSDNKSPIDYYILPLIDRIYDELVMVDMNPFYLEFYRFESLDVFFDLIQRTTLKEAI